MRTRNSLDEGMIDLIQKPAGSRVLCAHLGDGPAING